MALLFGVNINPTAKYFEEALTIADIADTGGVDMVGMQDHPYNGSFMDTWTLLSALGARTRRVNLMVNVANLPLRNPAMLAKAAATLDIITRGRVDLGLGAGAYWEGVESFGGVRRSPAEAVEAFEEGLKIIKLFFKPETSTLNFVGKHYVLKGAQVGPKPFHSIRLWVGGYGNRMLKITGELAEGLTVSLPYLPPEQLPAKLELVKQAALKSGRDPASILVNYNFGGVILESESQREKTQSTPNVIVGSIDEWVEMILRLSTLGVNSFSFWPAGEDKIGQVKLYVKNVVPSAKDALRKSA